MSINQTIGANETLPHEELASFFLLQQSTGEVDVRFFRGGREVLAAEGVGSGYSTKLRDTFDGIRITDRSGAPNTIKAHVMLDAEASFNAPPTGNVHVDNFPALPAKQGAYTRAAASVTNAAVAELFAAKATRRYAFVQNNDATKYLRLRVDSVDPTTATGVRVPPGGYWESPAGFAPTGAIRVIAETAGGIAVEALEG